MTDRIGIDLTRIDASADGAQWLLGTLVTHPTAAGDKKYKYIRYENGAAAVAGVAGEVAYSLYPNLHSL